MHSKTAGAHVSRARIALAACLTVASAISTAARASEADNACKMITSSTKMGANRRLIDQLIPLCNTSPASCAETLKFVTSIGFKYDALTCSTEPDAINANACMLIKTYADAGLAGKQDKQAEIEKLILSCNKSPLTCAEAVKALGEAHQKFGVLTCR